MPGDDRVNADELRRLVAGVRTNLALRARSGLQGVPTGATRRRQGPIARPPGTAPAAVLPAAEEVVAAEGVTGARGLQVLRDEIGDCRRCKLCSGRTNLVFGVGDPTAHLVFVGEGPGADEDAQGEPFVGKAGQLLDKMIEAMGYARGDVYICNVVKCRPPGNRNPEPDEIAACEPFLKKQLGAIRPRMIVALGKFAAQCLLRDDAPISRLRGNFRTYEGIQLMPTFHPAYLLRDPTKKKEAWEDLKTVMAALKRMGLGPPAR
jgi:uracil-DNA glycosylase